MEASRGVPGAVPEGIAHNCAFVGEANARLFRQVKAAAEKGSFVLTLGGDHSIGVGTVAGHLAARPNLGVVWVDAHADINTPLTSSSGNMHGRGIRTRKAPLYTYLVAWCL
jgi:arginase